MATGTSADLLKTSVSREEEIDRAARKRGRAYQCLRCLHRDGKEFIEVKNRVENHIMRDHLRRDEIPFSCSLCQFRCLKEEELKDHLKRYKRHALIAEQCGLDPLDEGCLRINPNSYKMGPRDYVAMEKEESFQHWRRALMKREHAKEDILEQAVLQTFGEEEFADIFQEETPTQQAQKHQVEVDNIQPTLVSISREEITAALRPLLAQLSGVIDPKQMESIIGTEKGTPMRHDTQTPKQQDTEREVVEEESLDYTMTDDQESQKGKESHESKETQGRDKGHERKEHQERKETEEERLLPQLLPDAEETLTPQGPGLKRSKEQSPGPAPVKRMRMPSESSSESDDSATSDDDESDDEEDQIKNDTQIKRAIRDNTTALRSMEKSLLTLAEAVTALAKQMSKKEGGDKEVDASRREEKSEDKSSTEKPEQRENRDKQEKAERKAETPQRRRSYSNNDRRRGGDDRRSDKESRRRAESDRRRVDDRRLVNEDRRRQNRTGSRTNRGFRR